MIKVGQKVQFSLYKEICGFDVKDKRSTSVTGTVVMVNERNHWFSVRYDLGGVKQRTSYNFSQIGKDVRLCGK